MLSEKQLTANRENAKKSTGPKTEETKKIVSQNALRHGLTGHVTLMPDEDRTAHDNFCAAIIADLAPEGAVETQFAQALAEDNWRMHRGRAMETNLFALGAFHPVGPVIDTGHDQIDDAVRAAQVFAADPKQFQLLSLYMQRTNRDMEKALNRLSALKVERRASRQQELEEAAALLQFNEIKRLPIPAAGITTGNGFVFSTTEIRLFLDRKRRLNELKTTEIRQNNHQNHFKGNNKHTMRRAA